MKRNSEIRQAIKNSNIYCYELAEELQISDNTFYRMLRKPLSPIKRNEILSIIKNLSAKKEHKELI